MKRLLYLLCFIMPSVIAGQYPVITSVDVHYDSKGADYNFTQKVIDIGPASETKVPSNWMVALGHKHYLTGYYDVGAPANNQDFFYNYDNSKTIGELVMDGYNNRGWGSDNYIRHDGPNLEGECIAYFAGPGVSGYLSTDWSRTLTPGGCLAIPPANEWCNITTPEILLEHGSITLRQADGDVASASIGVQCTTAMAVTFNLITQDKYVYLDDGKSEVTVNNQPLSSKIDLPQGDSQMPIKDLLSGVTKEGFHTGSSVLVMMPY